MKRIFKTTCLALSALMLNVACNNDDETVNTVNLQNLTVTLEENPSNGETIGTIQSSGGAAENLSITSQTPSGAMSINSNTGVLTVADATLFDFESNPTITATVTAGNAGNSATITVNLNNLTEVSLQNLEISIDENPTDGQVVGSLQGTGNGTFSYSITSQTPMGALAIDASTGEVTVTDPNLFDYETNPVITAEVSVTDGQETATAAVTINLNNVEEVSAQNTDLSIDENPANGDVIGTLQASGSNLTYTITFQNPAGAFSIDQNTGELSVADESLFDFETNPEMLVTISVSSGMQSVSANAFVEINDVNEIGEFKYGGVIFWIDPASNNNAGLVCALNNQASAAWGCSGTSTGATGTGIGTGEANTATIISAGCATGSAAEFASNLSYNGYNDWYLPSLDEFNEIAINYDTYIWPTIQANGGSALFGTVWTSSEVNGNNAYVAYLGGSSPTPIPKSVAVFNILPIRSFTNF